jgi:hypothetical protein
MIARTAIQHRQSADYSRRRIADAGSAERRAHLANSGTIECAAGLPEWRQLPLNTARPEKEMLRRADFFGVA